MPIGRPFGRKPVEKSSRLYEDRIKNAGKTPVEKASWSSIASLAGFTACLVAAGAFCISSGQVAVGIGLIVFGIVPCLAIIAMANNVVTQFMDGTRGTFFPQASAESFGPEAEKAFAIANKALSKPELAVAEANRKTESAATKAWFDDVRTSFDEVSITSEDGLRLVGHLLESNPGSANWLVYVHGLGGGWKNGLGIGRHFAEKGYNLLFVDMRAQGDSAGTVIGAGHLERRDLVQWCRWLVGRQGETAGIVLMGSSLGGVAVLEAAGEKDLPQQVRAVLSDSAFADFWNEAIHVMGTMGANGKALPAHPLLDVARLIFRSRKGGYDIAEPSAVAAIAHAQAPVLIIHGADDQLVTPYNAVRLDEAATAAGIDHELLQVPSAGHCCAAMADPELYYGTIFGFIDRH